MIKYLFAFLTAVFLMTTALHAQEWSVDKDKSSLKFNVVAEGNSIRGEFEKFSAEIKLDPEDTTGAQIKAVIEASSLKADDGTAVGTALSSPWLFAASFPKITYQSKSVKKVADGKYEIDGILTVKKLSKPLKLPFSLAISGLQARASGKVMIDRAMFDLGAPGDAGPSIEINLEIVALKK